MQLAKAYGIKVLGTAGTAEGEEVVKQAGASQVFNHRQDGYVQTILVLSLYGIRTERSPIQSVIIQVIINKIGGPRSSSPIC